MLSTTTAVKACAYTQGGGTAHNGMAPAHRLARIWRHWQGNLQPMDYTECCLQISSTSGSKGPELSMKPTSSTLPATSKMDVVIVHVAATHHDLLTSPKYVQDT